MKKIKFVLCSVLFMFIVFNSSMASETNFSEYNVDQIYNEMNLKEIINYDTFKNALNGFNKIRNRKNDLITIVDFTKPSTKERFYVLDLKKKSLLFKSVVAHGKNSGGDMATSFSNKNGSHKSSLGFYLTEGTYFGGNGYSLRLDGLEKGINDKAKERAIVVHGADYANPSAIKSLGRLGRSFGCPALPRNISKQVIDTIKNGSVLYIHGNDSNYALLSDLT